MYQDWREHLPLHHWNKIFHYLSFKKFQNFSVVKVTLHSQVSIHLSVCSFVLKTPQQLEIIILHPSTFIILRSSFKFFLLPSSSTFFIHPSHSSFILHISGITTHLISYGHIVLIWLLWLLLEYWLLLFMILSF